MNCTTPEQKRQGSGDTSNGQSPMTLSELAGMPNKLYLIPREVGELLNMNPYNINVAAQNPEYREKLGFPVIVTGTRVRIPRIPFLRFMGYAGEIQE